MIYEPSHFALLCVCVALAGQMGVREDLVDERQRSNKSELTSNKETEREEKQFQSVKHVVFVTLEPSDERRHSVTQSSRTADSGCFTLLAVSSQSVATRPSDGSLSPCLRTSVPRAARSVDDVRFEERRFADGVQNRHPLSFTAQPQLTNQLR